MSKAGTQQKIGTEAHGGNQMASGMNDPSKTTITTVATRRMKIQFGIAMGPLSYRHSTPAESGVRVNGAFPTSEVPTSHGRGVRP